MAPKLFVPEGQNRGVCNERCSFADCRSFIWYIFIISLLWGPSEIMLAPNKMLQCRLIREQHYLSLFLCPVFTLFFINVKKLLFHFHISWFSGRFAGSQLKFVDYSSRNSPKTYICSSEKQIGKREAMDFMIRLSQEVVLFA